jgi:hypothetical protein
MEPAVGSQMAVRLLALSVGRPLPIGRFLVTHFCERLSRLHGHSTTGRIRYIINIHLTGILTRDLPAYSIVPQPTTLPRASTKCTLRCSNQAESEGRACSTHEDDKNA